MPNDPLKPKPEYFGFDFYIKVRDTFKRSERADDNQERFSKIIEKVTYKPSALNWSDEIFTYLHKYLTTYNGYMGFGVEDYCRYINYWINGKVRESKYQKYRDHFKIFEDFVHNYAYEKQRNHTASCKSYIHKMEDADYNRMETLYKFYTFYDKLNLYARSVSNPECDNLSYYIALYNDVINDYYDNYRDLYNKINHVKNLIVSLVSNPTLSCKRYANFHAATNFLLDEQLKKEQARKEALEREQAEKAALAREQAEKAALARTQELEIESSRRIQPMQKTTEELQAGLRQGDTRMGVELEDLRTSRNLRVQEHSHVLSYPERSHNLGKLTEYRESSLSEQDEGQFEGVVSQSESEGTPKDSSFLSSLRIPRYITGVLGEIDPVPVVGVSGGMGALFLLFRYTPFGNFFRGGRGRAHRIPRSFNGQFLGGFPGYEDYDVGHIGYGPMNPLAE